VGAMRENPVAVGHEKTLGGFELSIRGFTTLVVGRLILMVVSPQSH